MANRTLLVHQARETATSNHGRRSQIRHVAPPGLEFIGCPATTFLVLCRRRELWPSDWRMKANNALSGTVEPDTIQTLNLSSASAGCCLATVSAPYAQLSESAHAHTES